MALRPGDRLGPYDVVALLGKGGMGEVYRAHDTRVHRDVAIKTSSERFTERFEREARAIAALNHSNVCTLYDVGPDYRVMELVEGQTLADRILQGAVPLDESLKLAAQVADALSAAHRKGVVHRDLKPGNIKVRPDGTVKVLDFGLAKVGGLAMAASDNSPTLSAHDTQAGVVLGTAAYMSPEQAKGKPVDKGADIWAFGVVLYEMLTGRQLHHGETLSEVLASVLKEAPDLSPDGKRVAYVLAGGAGNQDVWVTDIAGGGNTRLTFDPGPDVSPVWSPDGTRVAFAASRGGRRDLYEKNADGSGDERVLLRTDQDKTPRHWSRDGRFLLFESIGSKTREDLWILPLAGDRKPFVFLDTDVQERVGQFSPDQRWIAYTAGTSGAVVEVFVRPFSPDSRSAASSSGAQWMVSANGGILPRWSADGKRLFYLSLNGDLMVADVRAGVSVQHGLPQRLFSGITLRPWSVSPTGDRLLTMRSDLSAGPPPPFTLVLNWMAKLEKQ